MSDCVFCEKIDVGDFTGSMGSVVWFEPRRPVVPGHMLFVPARHIKDACEDSFTAGHVMEIATYQVKGSGDGHFIWNVGPDADQTIFHAHLHWVPRRPGDGVRLPWTGQAKGRAS